MAAAGDNGLIRGSSLASSSSCAMTLSAKPLIARARKRPSVVAAVPIFASS